MALDRGAGALQLSEPARGADDDVHAQARQALDIFRGGGGRGKFHGGGDATKILLGESFEVRVVVNIEAQLHGEAVLGREAFDEAAHFAIADDGEIFWRHAAPRDWSLFTISE